MSKPTSSDPLIGTPLQGAIPVEPPSAWAGFLAGPAPSLSGDCSCLEEAVDPPCFVLPEGWDNPCQKNEDVEFLLREGTKLATFSGSGVPVVREGKVSLEGTVPMGVTQLWHHYVSLNGAVHPAEPRPAPFLAVIDETGKAHAIAGSLKGPSTVFYDDDSKAWKVVPLAEAPKAHAGPLPEAATVRLTGHAPLEALGSPQAVHDLVALSGTGIVVLSQLKAPSGNNGCCSPAPDPLQTVAEVLPLPEGEGPFVLEFYQGELQWAQKETTEQTESTLLGDTL